MVLVNKYGKRNIFMTTAITYRLAHFADMLSPPKNTKIVKAKHIHLLLSFRVLCALRGYVGLT
jgi:hypothetical protein